MKSSNMSRVRVSVPIYCNFALTKHNVQTHYNFSLLNSAYVKETNIELFQDKVLQAKCAPKPLPLQHRSLWHTSTCCTICTLHIPPHTTHTDIAQTGSIYRTSTLLWL